MSYCQNCGNQINGKFCSVCGEPANGKATINASQPSNKSSNSTVFVVLVISVIIIGIVIYSINSKKESCDQERRRCLYSCGGPLDPNTSGDQVIRDFETTQQCTQSCENSYQLCLK